MSSRDKERKVIKPFHATVTFYNPESTKTWFSGGKERDSGMKWLKQPIGKYQSKVMKKAPE